MRVDFRVGRATVSILAPDEGEGGNWQLLIAGIGDPLKAERGFSFPTYDSLKELLPIRLSDNLGHSTVDKHWPEIEKAMEALYKEYRAKVPDL